MGQISERTDLLRILLADQDDANAFLFQCGVNRLGRSCAFQRVASRAQLPERFRSFRPNLLIAAGDFALPDVLKEMKQITNGDPIICAVKSFSDGEAAMEAGATDCVLITQVDELHACIERHLRGENQVPYFKKDLVREKRERTKGATKGPSKLDLKLQEFDRWAGALLKKFGKAAGLKLRKLERVSRTAYSVMKCEIHYRYKAAKVQWLLRKQRRLVKSGIPNVRSSDDEFETVRSGLHERRSTVHTLLPKAPNAYEETPPLRIVSTSPVKQPVEASQKQTEPVDAESLRALELSFKTLFHTSLDPMFLLDGLGAFLHANAPACALLGAAQADLLGKTLLDFVPVNERSQVSAMWEALLIEGQQKGEFHLQADAGEIREVYISARSNLWFGVHLLVVRDQTELKSLRNAMQNREQLA